MQQTRRSDLKSVAAGIVLAVAAAVPGVAAANHLEARIIGVSTWDAECSANTLTYWDDMVRFWYNEMPNWGWYSKDGATVDGNLNATKFCDPDANGSCRDYDYIDDADAVMIFMHGFDAGDVWGGVLRRNTGVGGDCSITFPQGGAADVIHAGDVDLEWMHMSSCNSLDKDNLPNSWKAFQDPVDSPKNGLRLHGLTGFHGFMWIGGCCDDQYEDFAADAHWVSVKDAWMDNMYVTGINGSSTQCPVSYAVGTNAADCFDRIDHERYNNVYSDPGTIGYYCYYYYPGCDPEGEGPF